MSDPKRSAGAVAAGRPGAESDGIPSGMGAFAATRSGKVILWLVAVIVALAVAWTLRETVWVTMPIAFAFFLAIAVYPIDAKVSERMPRRFRWVGHLAAMFVIVAAIAVFLVGVWFAAQQVAGSLPQYSQELQSLINTLDQQQDGQQGETQQAGQDAAAGGQQEPAATEQEPTATAQPQPGAGEQPAPSGAGQGGGFLDTFKGGFGTTGARMFDLAAGYADTILSSVWRTVAIVILIFFFTLLMLVEAPKWRDKVRAVSTFGTEEATRESVAAIAQRFRWYLLVRTILGVITGVLYGGWLWIFGVEFAFVFGLLAFLLNYIPTLGSLVAGIIPVIFAFVTKDFGTAVVVAVGLLVIEQVMGNYVDPRVQGKQLSISPLVLLFALLFWGWVWGVAGALLAAPMMIFLVVTFAHVKGLRKVALFLSNERSVEGVEEHARPG